MLVVVFICISGVDKLNVIYTCLYVMFICHYDIFALHLCHNFKSIIMKTNYLFPNRFKKIGWLLFIPGIILGVLCLIDQSGISFFDIKVIAIIAEQSIFSDASFFSILENNVLDEISSILLIIGAQLIAFSKEKTEDEFISKIRLESLVWATYINYAILIFAIIFIYDMTFLWVLVFNMFTLLVFFLIRFNWALYKSKNQISNEE